MGGERKEIGELAAGGGSCSKVLGIDAPVVARYQILRLKCIKLSVFGSRLDLSGSRE